MDAPAGYYESREQVHPFISTKLRVIYTSGGIAGSQVSFYKHAANPEGPVSTSPIAIMGSCRVTSSQVICRRSGWEFTINKSGPDHISAWLTLEDSDTRKFFSCKSGTTTQMFTTRTYDCTESVSPFLSQGGDRNYKLKCEVIAVQNSLPSDGSCTGSLSVHVAKQEESLRLINPLFSDIPKCMPLLDKMATDWKTKQDDSYWTLSRVSLGDRFSFMVFAGVFDDDDHGSRPALYEATKPGRERSLRVHLGCAASAQ